MKIIIVGGGTAGWLSAAFFSKHCADYDVTLVEDPDTPTIGVGESVTPHVIDFIHKLGINEEEWLRETGAIHKLANRFVDWVKPGHSEYFSFTYPFADKFIKSPNGHPESLEQYFESDTNSTLDAFLMLHNKGLLNKFDLFFNPQFHYMDNLSYHAEHLQQPHAVSHHIDANKTAEFLKNKVALRNGVKHIKAKVITKDFVDGKLHQLKLNTGKEILGDYFLDCTGFKRLLINDLDPEFKPYQYPIDSAIVGRSSYSAPQNEMTNYTQTIAKKQGWQFGVTLQNRKGNGYCYSSDLSNEEEVYNDFVKNTCSTPRKISWTPGRLKFPCKSNVISIGLSAGFVEPLEANNLYIIIKTIHLAARFLKTVLNEGFEDHISFNSRINDAMDDIKDFLLVHYTLANRTDTDFWLEMDSIGKERRHDNIVTSKIFNPENSMKAAFDGETLFPNYMWAQLAISWNIPIPNINKNFKWSLQEYLSYFRDQEKTHKHLASTTQKYFDYRQSL